MTNATSEAVELYTPRTWYTTRMAMLQWFIRAVALIVVLGYLKRIPGILDGVLVIAFVWWLAWIFRRYIRPGRRR